MVRKVAGKPVPIVSMLCCASLISKFHNIQNFFIGIHPEPTNQDQNFEWDKNQEKQKFLKFLSEVFTES